MLVDTSQDIGQVSVRVDVMEFARRDQALKETVGHSQKFWKIDGKLMPSRVLVLVGFSMG